MRHKTLEKYGYLLVSLSLIVAFFHPLVFSTKTLFFRDIHRWFYPMKYYLASCFEAGTIPYWCSNYFCGSPFLSDLQSGVFYPLSLVFALLPFPRSLNIFVLLHFFLGFYFFYRFLLGLGISRGAASAMSVSYCYGGYTIAAVNTLNNLSTLIWVPAILHAFTTYQDGRRSGLYLTVLALSMAFLGGEPQLAMMAVAMLLITPFFGLPTERKRISRVPAVVMAILCVLWALLICLVQLGPTYVDFQYSARSSGLTYEDVTLYSLKWSMLKHLLLPLAFPKDFATNPEVLKTFFPGGGHIPWLLTIYPGFIVIPLALFGSLLVQTRRTLLFAVIFLLCLLLSLGNNTPLHSVFYAIIPVFRFPEKFMLLANLSLLVLAAQGLDRLLTLLKTKRATSLCLLVTLLLIVDLYRAHNHLNPFQDFSFYRSYHPHLEPIMKDRDMFRVYVDPEIAREDGSLFSVLEHHLRWGMFLLPNIGAIHGVYHVDGTSGLELRYQYIIVELLRKPWPERIRFLELANVRYILSPQTLDQHPEIQSRVEKINPFLYRLKAALPRAWVVGRLHPIEKGTPDQLTDGSFDPWTSALGRETMLGRHSSPYHGTIDSLRYGRGGSVYLNVTSEREGILVLSESSFPGWRVFVNGKEKECLWLDLLFQGVEIEKGKSTIEFRFRPTGFRLYGFVSLASFLLFLGGWIFPHQRFTGEGKAGSSLSNPTRIASR
jgi:hypothetical protein